MLSNKLSGVKKVTLIAQVHQDELVLLKCGGQLKFCFVFEVKEKHFWQERKEAFF